MITYKFKIDLEGEREICENIVFTTGDKSGYRFDFLFYSNGKRIDTSLYGLTVKAKRADGAVIIDSGVTTKDEAYYIVADNAYSVKGELEFEVALLKADGTYATTKVILADVREGFGEVGLSSADNEPVLAKLEGQYLECRSANNAMSKEIEANTSDIRGLKSQVNIHNTFISTHASDIQVLKDASEEFNVHISGEDKNHSAKDITYSGAYCGAEQNVEDAINFLGEQITENENQISENECKSRNIFANALKGSASGEAFCLDDVSPVEHIMNVKVRKKNLIDINNPSQVISGSVYEVNGGTATVTRGTASYAPSINWILGDYADFVGKTLTASVKITEDNGTYSTSSTNLIYFTGSKGNNLSAITLQSQHITTGQKCILTFTVPENAEAEKLTIRLYLQRLINAEESASFTELQVEESTTATDWKPYVDLSTVKVKAQGKNFVDIPNYDNYTYSPDKANIQGTTITIEKLKDGNAPSIVWELGDYADFVGKTLTVSCDVDDIGGSDNNKTFAITTSYKNSFKEGGVVPINSISVGKSLIGKRASQSFTIPEQADYLEGKPLVIRLYLNQGNTIGDYLKVSNLQVEVGTIATEYEDYKEPVEYAVNEDGTVNNVASIYPNMTLLADTNGAVIDVEYNKDSNKVIEKLTNAIIALGGNI